MNHPMIKVMTVVEYKPLLLLASHGRRFGQKVGIGKGLGCSIRNLLWSWIVKIACHVASGGDIPYLLEPAFRAILLGIAHTDEITIANLAFGPMNFNPSPLLCCTPHGLFHHLSARLWSSQAGNSPKGPYAGQMGMLIYMHSFMT